MFRWLYCPEPQRKRPNQATITQPGHPKKKTHPNLVSFDKQKSSEMRWRSDRRDLFPRDWQILGDFAANSTLHGTGWYISASIEISYGPASSNKKFCFAFFFLDRVALHFFSRSSRFALFCQRFFDFVWFRSCKIRWFLCDMADKLSCLARWGSIARVQSY